MTRMHRKSTRRKAFSLVELIVVIGIIGILLALLMPALVRARKSANTVQCAANLHQLGVALFAYAAEHAGELPPTSGWQVYPDGSSPEDESGLAWSEMLISKAGAVPNAALYNCPAFPSEAKMNYFLTSRWPGAIGRSNIKLSQVTLSTAYVLSGDCTNRLEYPPPFGTNEKVTDDCDKDDLLSELIVFSGQADGLNIHPGGNNVLFADSHVALFDHFDRSSMTYHGSKMKSWNEVAP